MSFDKFKENALRTEAKVEKMVVNTALIGPALNLAIASAAILDHIKKNIFYGKEIEAGSIAAEMRAAHLNASLMLYNEAPMNDANIQPVYEHLDPRVFHGVIGKFTEAGELLQAIATVANGQEIDKVNVAEEIGDDQWYNAILVDALGMDMDNIQDTVIAKLQKRYPDKFTSDAAINRDLEAERQVLEANVEAGAQPVEAEATV